MWSLIIYKIKIRLWKWPMPGQLQAIICLQLVYCWVVRNGIQGWLLAQAGQHNRESVCLQIQGSEVDSACSQNRWYVVCTVANSRTTQIFSKCFLSKKKLTGPSTGENVKSTHFVKGIRSPNRLVLLIDGGQITLLCQSTLTALATSHNNPATDPHTGREPIAI